MIFSSAVLNHQQCRRTGSFGASIEYDFEIKRRRVQAIAIGGKRWRCNAIKLEQYTTDHVVVNQDGKFHQTFVVRIIQIELIK